MTDETCECCEPTLPENIVVTPVAADEPLPADCPARPMIELTAKRRAFLRKAKLAKEAEQDRKAQALSGIFQRMTRRERKRLCLALVKNNRIEVAIA